MGGRADSVVERGDICFTCSPNARAAPPRPFVVAARTVLLVEPSAPAVLILGYGLGFMGAQVGRLRPAALVCGVERSRRLATAARKHLPPGTELVCDDALTFLRRIRRRFDLIIDDCFVLRGRDAIRPRELRGHAALVRRRLRPGGLYVRNLLPQGQLSSEDQVADMRRSFSWLQLRRFRDWDNILALASTEPRSNGALRRLAPR